MTFILPSFGASAIAAVPGGGGGAFSNTYSVDLDGSNEYVDIGDLTALNSASTFSMSMWWKTPSSSEKIMVGSDSTTGIGMYQWSDGSFYVHAGASNVFGSGITPPGYNQWNFVLVTYNSSGDVKAYFNGSTTPANTASATALGASAGDGFRIGKYEGYPTAYSEGFIDEVAIFSSELSSSDSATLWNSGVPADISSLNPVGWWRMGDTDTGVSNGSSTPTIVSNVANSSAIKNHYALDFDGSNHYIQTSYAPASSLGFTMSFWMKSSNTSSSIGFVSNGTSAGNPGGFQLLSPSGTKAFYVLVANSSGSTNVNNNVGGSNATLDVRDGEWHHIAATISGTSVKIYKDGGDAAINSGNPSNTQGTPFATWTSSVAYTGNTGNAYYFGRNGAYNGYSYEGLLDEVALFETELTGSNISAIYNSGVPADLGTNGLNLNPTGWWRMGDGGTWDGSNWSIPDAANSNTGTTVNMVEVDRVTDTPTANGILVNGPTYSNIAP